MNKRETRKKMIGFLGIGIRPAVRAEFMGGGEWTRKSQDPLGPWSWWNGSCCDRGRTLGNGLSEVIHSAPKPTALAECSDPGVVLDHWQSLEIIGPISANARYDGAFRIRHDGISLHGMVLDQTDQAFTQPNVFLAGEHFGELFPNFEDCA
jgi:hypothetical protein